jgi:hypothetical protein
MFAFAKTDLLFVLRRTTDQMSLPSTPIARRSLVLVPATPPSPPQRKRTREQREDNDDDGDGESDDIGVVVLPTSPAASASASDDGSLELVVRPRLLPRPVPNGLHYHAGVASRDLCARIEAWAAARAPGEKTVYFNDMPAILYELREVAFDRVLLLCPDELNYCMFTDHSTGPVMHRNFAEGFGDPVVCFTFGGGILDVEFTGGIGFVDEPAYKFRALSGSMYTISDEARRHWVHRNERASSCFSLTFCLVL